MPEIVLFGVLRNGSARGKTITGKHSWCVNSPK
jgi:hypothetical protein